MYDDLLGKPKEDPCKGEGSCSPDCTGHPEECKAPTKKVNLNDPRHKKPYPDPKDPWGATDDLDEDFDDDEFDLAKVMKDIEDMEEILDCGGDCDLCDDEDCKDLDIGTGDIL